MQLEDVQGLAERMAALMGVAEDSVSTSEAANNKSKELEDGIPIDNPLDAIMRKFHESKEEGEVFRWLELEELDIDDTMFLSFDIPSKFPVCCPTLDFVFAYSFIEQFPLSG